MNMSAHGVTAIELTDVAFNGKSWVKLRIRTKDYVGEHVTEIDCFPRENGAILRVDQPTFLVEEAA